MGSSPPVGTSKRAWHGDVVTATTKPPTSDAVGGEVDESLLAWYRELSMLERLRAASRAAATLERLRRAASTDR